jgi:hypothetical protein
MSVADGIKFIVSLGSIAPATIAEPNRPANNTLPAVALHPPASPV